MAAFALLLLLPNSKHRGLLIIFILLSRHDKPLIGKSGLGTSFVISNNLVPPPPAVITQVERYRFKNSKTCHNVRKNRHLRKRAGLHDKAQLS